jgi:hypothetical protein
MTSSLLFKISSGLLFLFSLIHLYGIFKPPVQGAAAELVSSVMRTIHFDIMGSRRNYWDFYFGFGLLLTVFHLFSAVLAWQFSGLDRQALKQVRVAAWGLAVSYAAVAILSWSYFFIAPAIISSVIALCLLISAALASRPD